jgi:DNA-binding CsgD family transcriptional regulator
VSVATAAAVERAAAAHGLTPAEARVLALLVEYGFSNRELAVCLSVSPETVRTHLKRVFDKLGVDSRLQAVLKVNGVVRHPIG